MPSSITLGMGVLQFWWHNSTFQGSILIQKCNVSWIVARVEMSVLRASDGFCWEIPDGCPLGERSSRTRERFRSMAM